MKQILTDIHHHLLFGMDDGARDEKEMHAMLRMAAENGIGRIVATPHVTPGIERFNREQYDAALRIGQAYCDENQLGIELYGGAEILYTEQTCRFLEDGRVPTMAGTEFVLVEFSPDIRYAKLHDALSDLCRYGYVPIVAHVERYYCLLKHPARLQELKRELRLYFQVNCGTIIKQRNFTTRHFLKKMMNWDLLDVIGTDAHHAANVRTCNMRDAWYALKREFGREYAYELADGHLLFAHSLFGSKNLEEGD